MKRRVLSLILAMVMVFSLLPSGMISVSAATEGVYTYTVSNGEATITDVDTSVSGNVVIPDRLGGYPVTKIGDSAFNGCENVSVIYIPDGVTSIGGGAFAYCYSLVDIYLPNGVTSIGGGSFTECQRLKSIHISGSVRSIGDWAFYGCYALTDVYCVGTEEDRENIDIGTNNDNLLNATWHYEEPECSHYFSEWSVSSEPECEYEGEETRECIYCGEYETRVLEATGHSFGDWSVSIEPECEYEGEEERVCQNGCGHFETRVLSATGHSFSEWEEVYAPGCDYEGEEKRYCLNGCGEEQTRYTEATGHNMSGWAVEEAPECEYWGYEIRYCQNGCGYDETRDLKPTGHSFSEWQVSVPATCTTAGEGIRVCLNGCGKEETKTIKALGHLYDPDGDMVCNRCGELNEMLSYKIVDGEATITALDFSYEGAVIVPDSIEGCPVTVIGKGAFSQREITAIKLPETITVIEESAFLGCDITEIDLPDGLETIGKWAFDACSIRTIEIPESVTSFGEGVFRGSGLTGEIYVPANIKKLPFNTFASTYITSVRIAEGVEFMAVSAFEYCYELETVYLPLSVKTIDNAFYDCMALTDVYYAGDETDKAEITLYDEILRSDNVTWHYNWGKETLGDYSGDGEVDITDVQELFLEIVNGNFEEVSLAVGDINGDGEFNIIDVRLLFVMVANGEI